MSNALYVKRLHNYQLTIHDFINDIAREYYLRDWKLAMERTIRRIKFFVPRKK